MVSALESIAQQAASFAAQDIPETVLNQARLCILDTLGCILAGSRTEEADLILKCEPLDGKAAISIFGTSHKRGLHEAIRINAYLGDVLELNDLIGGHASIGTVSAVLALGEALGSSGVAVLNAVVQGIEVTSRIYEAIYPSLRRYTEMGLVPVGIPSTIGVAAAAAQLLKLDDQQTLNALAIAGGLAGWCPAEVIFGQGGTVKPMLFGAQPADIGVTAAYYARSGMTGPKNLLDSKLGYFATASTQGFFDPSAWKERWALEQPRRKLHACCGYLHSPVDALCRLRKQIGIDALQQSQIVVHVAPYVADVVSKDRLPTSPNDARFHLQYCLAQIACGSNLILPEHSIELIKHLDRSDIRKSMENITVLQDLNLNHYHHCRIEINNITGQSFSQILTTPRGSPQDPLSDSEVIGKFRILAEPMLGQERTEEIVSNILGLASVEDVRTLTQSLATRTEMTEA